MTDLMSLVPLETLVPILIGLTAILSVATLLVAGMPNRPSGARVRTLLNQRSASQRRKSVRIKAKRADKLVGAGFVQDVAGRLNLYKTAQAERITLVLARAGWRGRTALAAYLCGKLLLPAVAVLLVVVISFSGTAEGDGTTQIILCLGLIVAGFYAPDYVVHNAAIRRRESLRSALPDGLDLMVICAESGLSLEPTLARVARETEAQCPELSDELALTAAELRFLPERAKALEGLAQRANLPGYRAVATLFQQTEHYGTPLADALRILAEEQRTERMLRAEEKAARLPALLTLPMILFIFPPLMIVLVGPAFMKIAFEMG